MMIQGLNKLPRPWMNLFSKSRVNKRGWLCFPKTAPPTQPIPHATLTISETQTLLHQAVGPMFPFPGTKWTIAMSSTERTRGSNAAGLQRQDQEPRRHLPSVHALLLLTRDVGAHSDLVELERPQGGHRKRGPAAPTCSHRQLFWSSQTRCHASGPERWFQPQPSVTMGRAETSCPWWALSTMQIHGWNKSCCFETIEFGRIVFFSHQSCKTYKISSNSPASVVFTTTSWGWGWFSPHAVCVYIYTQMYNPKISGSMKVTKQEAGKKNTKPHSTQSFSKFTSLWALQTWRSCSLASCRFPPSLYISFPRTETGK